MQRPWRYALLKSLFPQLVILFVSLLGANATAQQLASAAGQLLIPRSGFEWNVFRSVGTVASADEICGVLSHPFFRRPLAAYRVLDSMNSDLRWDGIEAAHLWVQKRFAQSGIARQRLSLNPDTAKFAEQQLSECLMRKESEHPELYRILKTHLLHYLDTDCHKPVYEARKTVDNNGNITETRVAVGKRACIDFNYNSGDYGSWNPTTFALMLIWKEAHPVLNTVFTRGDTVLQALLDDRLRKETQAKAEADERRRLASEKSQEVDRQWREYMSREKSLLEEVLNFATTGDVKGTRYERWVESRPCVVTNGRRQIDVQRLNMTAFRVGPEIFGNSTYLVSSDGNVRFSTSTAVPVDRLRKAWALAFKQCPGTTSRF